LGALVTGRVSVPGALLLHAALDAVPHWDYTCCRRRMAWAYLDVGGSLALAVVLRAAGAPRRIVATAALSALPDLDSLSVLVPRVGSRQLFPAHWSAFPHGSSGKRSSLAAHAAVAGISLALIARSARSWRR
jgi:hypothetical protein